MPSHCAVASAITKGKRDAAGARPHRNRRRSSGGGSKLEVAQIAACRAHAASAGDQRVGHRAA